MSFDIKPTTPPSDGPAPGPSPTPSPPQATTDPQISVARVGQPLQGGSGIWIGNPDPVLTRDWTIAGDSVGMAHTPQAADEGKEAILNVTGTNSEDAVIASSQPVIIGAASSSLPSWIANLPLFQWHRIPGSAMSSQRSPLHGASGGGTARARVTAWCGATGNRATNEYLVAAAGGHGDYMGNEVVGIDLSAESPTWQMRRNASKHSGTTTNPLYSHLAMYQLRGDIWQAEVMADYSQGSTHTYFSTHFLPDGAAGKIAMPGSSGPGPAAFLIYNGQTLSPPQDFKDLFPTKSNGMTFDLATNEWDTPNSIVPRLLRSDSAQNVEGRYPSHVDACECQNWKTGDIWQYRNTYNYGMGICKYTAATRTWQNFPGLGNWLICPSAVDHVRETLLFIPGAHSRSLGSLALFDISNGGCVRLPDPSFSGLGLSELTSTGNSSCCIYIEALDSYLFAFNASSYGGMEIRFINAATWEVTEPSISRDPNVNYTTSELHAPNVNGSTKAPMRAASHNGPLYSGSDNGVYNGMVYFPLLGIVAYCNAEDVPMWALRIHNV